MRLLPLWFVMTDGEENSYHILAGRHQELVWKSEKYHHENYGRGSLTDGEAEELRNYREWLEEIDKRQPDYAALWHNFWIELAATVLETGRMLTRGSMNLDPNILREMKRLPYKTETKTLTV